MERHINTYQGMNKDTAYDSIQPSLYIDALDIRITTTNGESMGGWTNIKGNKESFTIPTEAKEGEPFGPWVADTPEIIGYTTIRNKIILFVADISGTKGWIYEVQYNPATREILPGFPELKYYNDSLFFKKEWPIEALGRYESDCVQRVYWTDYNNYFRSLNITDPDLATFPVGQIDIFPDLSYTQPLLKIITGGGSILSGVYQVAYRLVTIDGKETLISPPSNLVHVVANNDNGQSARYNGDTSVVVTGKSLEFEVDTTDYTDFDKIEFIIIHATNQVGTPTVTSVESIAINNQTTINFVYTGTETSAFPIEVFDFISKNNPFKTPKTLAQKDSALVIANIKGSSITLQDLLPQGETFDAKTRRYRNIGGTIEPPFPIDPDPSDPTGNNLKNAFNEDYNKDAHWDTAWHTNSQYRYQLDGSTLGGDGPNISYKFHLEEFTLDGEKAVGQEGFANVADIPVDIHNLNDGYGNYANTTWPNHASPFISGLIRGYKRGETYRFGIVFYTKKGEASFVEYIGDIKFPDISEEDSGANNSGTNYWPICQPDGSNDRLTLAYSMGIKFYIDFSSCPSIYNVIDSYQIVRVKREDVDKRRLTQGIMKSFFFNVIESPTSSFDFRATSYGNSTNVLHLLPNSQIFGNTAIPHSFGLIGDSQSAVNNLPPSTGTPDDYLIKSQYLGFYSPEISFGFGNYRTLSSSLSNNPCLLMTGAYDGTPFSPASPAGTPISGSGALNISFGDTGIGYTPPGIPTPSTNYQSDNLSYVTLDIRKKYSGSIAISYNSIENIKKLKETSLPVMTDTTGLQDTVTPLWVSITGGFHVRNYWALDNLQFGDHLNSPAILGYSGLIFYSEVSKGGTSLLTLTDRITTDPISGASVTPAATDFFRIKGNTTISGGIEALYTVNTNPNAGIANEYYPILDLVLPKKEIYGGFNKSALTSNIFIIASPVIDLANIDPIVFGGDTFINMFTCQTSTVLLDEDFFNLGGTSPGSSSGYSRSAARTDVFPVETVMNLDLAYGATLRTEVYYSYGSIADSFILRQEINNTKTTYGKVKSMYAYNSVYSRENQDVTFFVEPESESTCKINDVRAYLSNTKVNGEVIDSWTKFGSLNFYDIDDYGPINKILNWKDSVHFFQDKAVGIYAINRSAVTTTNDGVPTQLGTGEGFGKHQYYSKEHGAMHQWAVQSTENGIYYFDALHRKFYRIQGSGIRTENSPLSELSGIHSWLQKLPDIIFTRKENGGDNPILKKGVTAGYDKINDEIIFTFLGTGNYVLLATSTTYTVGTIVYVTSSELYYVVTEEFTSSLDKEQAILDLLTHSTVASNKNNFVDDTIVFDELMNQFSTRYSATPKIWINNGDILLSPSPEKSTYLFTHNIGNWGEFYSIPQEASITMVLNFQADINKILRTLEFNSIVRTDSKVIDRSKTITAFKITTEYQSTNKVAFSADRIKRKFDKWRVKIPRNQLSTARQDRLRSTHFVVTLYFDNLENKEIICNRLMSYYDFQMF